MYIRVIGVPPPPMALVFLGRSECPLCGKLLLEGEEIMGLPPISNQKHHLYPYFDQGLHVTCFEHWNKKDEALRLVQEEKAGFENSDYYKEMTSKYGKPNNQS